MKRFFALLLILAIVFSMMSSCKSNDETMGEPGPQGEKGDKGDVGEQGPKGDKGDDGLTPYIGENGNWWIGTVDTGVAAQGSGSTSGGSQGLKGDKGDDGLTPYIGENGNWYIGTTDTGIAAQGSRGENGAQGPTGATGPQGPVGATGEKGDNGADGRGILKVEIINGHLWITYTDNPGTPIDLGEIVYSDHEGTEGLDFYLLPDGTYGVKAGTAYYLDYVVIPTTYKNVPVTQILPNAFENAPNLIQITIPDTITEIGDYAFNNCLYLQSANLPQNLKKLGAYSFNGCSSLSDVLVFPSTLEEIPTYCFNGCQMIKEITIPESVTTIYSYAFYNTGLTNVTILGSTTWTVKAVQKYYYQRCSDHGGYAEDRSGDPINDSRFNNDSKLHTLKLTSQSTTINYLIGTKIHFGYIEDNDSCHYMYYSQVATISR